MIHSQSSVLTIVGLVMAGQFTFQRFITSFLLGFAISMVIGMIMNDKMISDIEPKGKPQ